MSCYIAFNVETLNHFSNRMNAIGVSVIGNDVVTDSYYSLVNPETHFDYFNVQLTGISAGSAWHAPTSPKIQEGIVSLIGNGLPVVHNAAFDMGVPRKYLNAHGITWKSEVPYLCTAQMEERPLPGIDRKLNVLCEYYGIELDHHKAGSDSRTCAEALLRYLESDADPHPFIRDCSLQFREI